MRRFAALALVPALVSACATANDPTDPAKVVGVDYELRSHPLGADKRPITPRPGPEGAPEWRPGEFMAQAIGRAVGGALQLQAKHEHLGFYDEGACVLGAFVSANGSIDMTLAVTPGHEYVVMAAGDEDVRDMNLRVDADGSLVGEDVADDAVPLVKFLPKGDRVRVVLSMIDMDGGGSFGAVVLLEAKGVRLAPERVKHAVGTSLATAGSASAAISAHVPSATGLVFQAGGEWAFYATLLEPKEWWRTSGVDLEGPSVLLGGGDGIARKLTIEVRRGETIVARAGDKDDRPLAVLREAPTGPVAVTLSNEDSPQVSLATLVVLRTE